MSATEDLGYQMPWGAMAVLTVIVIGLALLALKGVLLPHCEELGRAGRRAPRPGVVGFVSMYLTMAFLTMMRSPSTPTIASPPMPTSPPRPRYGRSRRCGKSRHGAAMAHRPVREAARTESSGTPQGLHA